MKFIVLFVFFIFLLFVHATILSVPIFVSALLLVYIFKKESWAFPLGFLGGIFLDIMTVRDLGISSLFLLFFVLIIALYQNKFEIKTIPFVLLATFLGTLFYLILFDYNFVLGQSLINAFLAGGIFLFLEKKLNKKITY